MSLCVSVNLFMFALFLIRRVPCVHTRSHARVTVRDRAGVGLSTDCAQAVQIGQSLFSRDWNSSYTRPVPAKPVGSSEL